MLTASVAEENLLAAIRGGAAGYLLKTEPPERIVEFLRGAAEGYEQVFTKHLWSIFRFLGPNALAWHYQTAAGLYFKAGDENNAHRCLRRAFLFSPFRPKIILSRVQRLIRSNI